MVFIFESFDSILAIFIPNVLYESAAAPLILQQQRFWMNLLVVRIVMKDNSLSLSGVYENYANYPGIRVRFSPSIHLRWW
jgi:hypothetical protein